MDRVERRAAVVTGVEVALAGAHFHLEPDEPARRDSELRLLGAGHAAVEDDARVRATLVLTDEVDNRIAANLLLSVACDAEIHRQRLLGSQELGRLQQREELALVVCDAACVVPAVALRELERRRVPELERRRRLHVEVSVDHHRRRVGAVRVRRDVADDEIALAAADELGLAADALHVVAHPLGRKTQVVLVRRVGAHAWDRDELAQLLEPDLVHEPGVYAVGPRDSTRRRGA